MTGFTSPTASRNAVLYVLAYLLWLVSIAACIAAVIQLRSTANVLCVALGGNRYSVSLVNQVSLLVGGLIAFTYVVFLESYYRQSVTYGEKSQQGSEPAPSSGRIAQWRNTTGLAILLKRFATTIAIPVGLYLMLLGMLEISLHALR